METGVNEMFFIGWTEKLALFVTGCVFLISISAQANDMGVDVEYTETGWDKSVEKKADWNQYQFFDGEDSIIVTIQQEKSNKETSQEVIKNKPVVVVKKIITSNKVEAETVVGNEVAHIESAIKAVQPKAAVESAIKAVQPKAAVESTIKAVQPKVAHIESAIKAVQPKVAVESVKEK